MPKFFLATFFVILALLISAGCSDDDDCPNCPTEVDTVTVTDTLNDTLTITDTLNLDPRKLIVGGEIYVYDGDLSFWCDIYDSDGRMPELDSLTIAGEVIELNVFYDDGAICYETESELFDPGYVSGDDVEIIAYTPYCAGTCEVTLFDYDGDGPVFIGWENTYPYDTVAIGTEIVLDWNAVTNADWYAYRIYHYYDSAGSRFTRVEDWTDDTTLTIAAAGNGFDGYWEVYVYATSGPSPDDIGGNFTGCDAVNGAFTSSARGDIRVYVGTGSDYAAASSDPDDTETLWQTLRKRQER